MNVATRLLAAEPESARAARALVRNALDEWGRRDLVECAELLTCELATNAILYTGAPFQVTVVLSPTGTARVEVADNAMNEPVPQHPPIDATGGRGLELVETLASAWGSRPTAHGKVVWFEI